MKRTESINTLYGILPVSRCLIYATGKKCTITQYGYTVLSIVMIIQVNPGQSLGTNWTNPAAGGICRNP